MKCKVCGASMDNAGDDIYYCSKCKKCYNADEGIAEQADNPLFDRGTDFLGSSGMSELDKMRTELKRSENDLFSGERIYDTAENGYSSTTESYNNEPEKVTYEDKREVIDETKMPVQTSTIQNEKKPESAQTLTNANDGKVFARIFAAIFMTWLGCSTILLSLPFFVVILIMAIKCKKEAKTAVNPKKYTFAFGFLIFLDCIVGFFAIITLIVLGMLAVSIIGEIFDV